MNVTGARPAPGITCVGGAVVDRKLYLVGPAVAATSNPARAAASFGGVARNVAENLARLGARVRLCSCVGDDADGRALLGHLATVGVDATAVRTVPGRTTAQYVAVLDHHGELVIAAAVMDVLDEVGVGDLDGVWPAREPARAGGWLLLDCNLGAVVLQEALARAGSGDVRLAVDAVSAPKVTRLPATLAGTSVLFCNADEAGAWLAHHRREVPADAPARAQALRDAGARAVVLTLGARGAVVCDAAGTWEVPAVPASPVDVTGAGDALVAGTLVALAAGSSLGDAVRRGSAAAALTVESEHSVRPDLDAAAVERTLAKEGP